MLIKELQFSKKKFLLEFHDWITKNNKKAILYIESIDTLNQINDLLNVKQVNKVHTLDLIDCESENLKIRISYTSVRKPNGSTSYYLTSYHNVTENLVYLLPNTQHISELYINLGFNMNE